MNHSIFQNVEIPNLIPSNSIVSVESLTLGYQQEFQLSALISRVVSIAEVYSAAVENANNIDNQAAEVIDVNISTLESLMDIVEVDLGIESDSPPGVISRGWTAIKKVLSGIKEWFAKQWSKAKNFIKGFLGNGKEVTDALTEAEKSGTTVKVNPADTRAMLERVRFIAEKAKAIDRGDVVTEADLVLKSLEPLLIHGSPELVSVAPAVALRAHLATSKFIESTVKIGDQADRDVKSLMKEAKDRDYDAQTKLEIDKVISNSAMAKSMILLLTPVGRLRSTFKALNPKS